MLSSTKGISIQLCIKKTYSYISNLLIAIVVLVAILLAGVRLVGFDVYTVLSGSMEPAYHVGGLVYVKDVAATDIATGDVITFSLNADTVATHRVVAVVTDEPDGLYFQTKGDANDIVDANLVHENNVVGKVMFAIPLLGYVAEYIQHPPGLYVAIGAGALLLILAILPELLKKEENET